MEFTLSLVDKISGSAKSISSEMDGLASKMGGLEQSLTKMSSGMSGAGSSSMGMQAELAEMTGGLSIVVEAAAAVAVAFGAVTLAGMAMAIEANEAKQRMLSLFDALGEGKISGAETVAMLDSLGDSLGMTRAKLAPIAQSFLTLGITGKEQLEGLTKAAASAGAIAEGGAAKFATFFGQVNAAAETGSKLTIPFKKLEKQLAGVGLNIGDMAKQMGITEAALSKGLKAGTIDATKFGAALTAAASNKGAGALAQQGASLTNIWAKFQENIMKLFENIDVGPFLEQVKDLFSIFGQGTNSGKALTAGIGGFFKLVFAQATKVVPLVKHFMLDLIILGLKAYLSIKPIIKAMKDFAQSAQGASMINTVLSGLWEVLKVVGIAALVVVGVLVALWAISVAVGLAIWTLIGAFVSLVADGIDVQIKAFTELGSTISGFVTGAIATLSSWASEAVQMASNFIEGLISGITSGAGKVIGAVKDLAAGAKNAFKNALGIHSPSTEMAKLGKFAGDGVAVGLDSSTATVSSSAGDLGGSAASGAAAGMGGGGGSGGGKGGMTVTVEAGAIVIQGAGAGAMELTEQAISLLFERIMLQEGL